MKKYFIILFISFFCSCTNHSKNNDQDKANSNIQFDSDIKRIKCQFSNIVLLSAVRRITPDAGAVNKINYLEYQNSLSALLENNPTLLDSLLLKIQNDKNNKILIRKIYNWCEAYTILGMTYNPDNVVFPEEIIYEIPMTNNIVIGLLKNKQQDWGSLSESQIYELQYLVCDFLSGIDDKSRINFYKTYFERIEIKVTDDLKKKKTGT